MDIRPQKGPQEDFAATPADIAVFGGANFGGKTFWLVAEPGRHIHLRGFTAIEFRRTTKQHQLPGSTWDTAEEIYPYLGGVPREHRLDYTFPAGVRIPFSHLEYESNIRDHDGAQYCYIGIDQAEQFSKRMILSLLARNRTLCEVKPYMRMSANPDSTCFLREMLDWWIGKDGFPIKQKSGILRYFTVQDNNLLWVDRDWKSPEGVGPLSFTFIPSKYSDNPIGMQRNPTYVSNLNALPRVDRLRKKEGNWNVTEAEGMFEASWFRITENIPKGMRLVRYWDRAATEVTKNNSDPDWTAGVLCGKHDGILYIVDVQHFREGPGENERRIKQTAEIDGKEVQIGLEQEPGSSGKDVIHHYITKVLNGYWVTADLPTGDKIVRAKQWCGLAEHGYVCLKKAPWNHSFINEAASFPHGKKDQIDGTSGANKLLVTSGIGFTSSSQVAREDAERERAERQAAE